MPLAAGIAIGRIGCFLSGLPDGTYGTPTSLPWGVDLGDGVARHPTALYESLFMIVLAAVLARVEPHARRGDAFKLFMASYLTFRLLVDGIKPGYSAGARSHGDSMGLHRRDLPTTPGGGRPGAIASRHQPRRRCE